MFEVKQKFVIYEVGECNCDPYRHRAFGSVCPKCNGSGTFRKEVDLLDALKELGIVISEDNVPLYGLDD